MHFFMVRLPPGLVLVVSAADLTVFLRKQVGGGLMLSASSKVHAIEGDLRNQMLLFGAI